MRNAWKNQVRYSLLALWTIDINASPFGTLAKVGQKGKTKRSKSRLCRRSLLLLFGPAVLPRSLAILAETFGHQKRNWATHHHHSQSSDWRLVQGQPKAKRPKRPAFWLPLLVHSQSSDWRLVRLSRNSKGFKSIQTTYATEKGLPKDLRVTRSPSVFRCGSWRYGPSLFAKQ